MILKALIILITAAILEVGGDALIRIGLQGATYSVAAGAVTLFAYGILVNQSGLDFNRLMEDKASDPRAWPEPFRRDPDTPPRLIEIAPGHCVEARAWPVAAGRANGRVRA